MDSHSEFNRGYIVEIGKKEDNSNYLTLQTERGLVEIETYVKLDNEKYLGRYSEIKSNNSPGLEYTHIKLMEPRILWPIRIEEGGRLLNEFGLTEAIYSVENFLEENNSKIIHTIRLDNRNNIFRAYALEKGETFLMWQAKKDLSNKLKKVNLAEIEQREKGLYDWQLN